MSLDRRLSSEQPTSSIGCVVGKQRRGEPCSVVWIVGDPVVGVPGQEKVRTSSRWILKRCRLTEVPVCLQGWWEVGVPHSEAHWKGWWAPKIMNYCHLSVTITFWILKIWRYLKPLQAWGKDKGSAAETPLSQGLQEIFMTLTRTLK